MKKENLTFLREVNEALRITASSKKYPRTEIPAKGTTTKSILNIN